MADSRSADAGIYHGTLRTDRGHRDFSEMTPEEIVEWWID